MEKEIGYITSLIVDPVRTNILWSLLDGRAYTATELAIQSDTSPQNISMHIKKLIQADLLTAESQGRHKYYRFSKPEVAYAMEAIGSLIPKANHKVIVSSPNNQAIKYCRTCYDHLAGKVGVMLTDGLIKQKLITLHGSQYEVTKKGNKVFDEFGINTNELSKGRRTFAKPCLDWSERRHHLAGSLGAAILDQLLTLGWIRRVRESRAVIISSKGHTGFY
jgi:DNA-binding transcriptional ArsR family regulator